MINIDDNDDERFWEDVDERWKVGGTQILIPSDVQYAIWQIDDILEQSLS